MRKIKWQIDRCRGIPYRAAPCLLWQSNRNLCTSNEKDSTSSKHSNAKDSTGDYASSSSETLDEIRVEDRIPRDIVTILDEYIVGQNKAKRAMAVALRNRWRRNRVEDTELRSAILPKNILLVGPTGVGKTEISRRMARITDAPFVKVEATKYTEVGFAGKDVDTMIEDLYSASKIVARKQLEKARTQEVKEAVEAILVEKLAENRGCSETEARTLLQSGEAEEVEITYEITTSTDPASEGGLDPFGLGKKFPGNRELSAAFRSLFQGLRSGFGGDATEADPTSMVRSVKPLVRPIRLAREDLFKEELSKRIPNAAITQRAAVLCQEHGIVFIDEIDKVVVGAGARRGGGNTNEEGVQHDLLPILEGTSVTTKDGTVLRTDNILFIASGAFHAVKPSDMVAELQGRLPIRVELEALGMEDLCKILTTPRFNILKQMVHLLKTENITLRFANDAVREMAQVSKRWNDSMQNIGARRLHTILEQVSEKYCFDVEQYQGQEIELTKADVKEALQRFEQTMDLAKYLL